MKDPQRFETCHSCPSHEKCLFFEIVKKCDDSKKTKIGQVFVKKGEALFHQDSPVFGPYCISKGSAKIFSVEEDGKEVIFHVATKGDLIGASGLFGHMKHGHSATAMEDLTCCYVESKSFMTAVRSNDELVQKFVQRIGENLQASYTKQSQLMRLNVRQRLATYLKELGQKHGNQEEEDGVRINLRMSREEMASALGTACETLIRLLSEFRESKIISEKDKFLYILNPQALDLAAKGPIKA